MSREKKTIKLHELREAMDTDARKRLDAQEETIRRLIAENKTVQSRLEYLQKRCFASTRGRECDKCPLKPACKGVETQGQLSEEEQGILLFLNPKLKVQMITKPDTK